ncbi:MAG: LemA family protein [Bdellovibrionales bacterium GWB1_55_8]|nr:MAG: LemA family protein [Bdellovibrionales bacterium GWB1_55_8]
MAQLKFPLQKLLLFWVATTLLSGCGIQSIPTAQNEVEAAWSEVLNQYKRRADLIPNLVQVVKQYASHEKQTLQAVVEARSKATSVQFNADQLTQQNLEKFSQAQAGLSTALSRLMVVVEKYPDLKANENFRDLQVQLEGTENRVTIARQRYIEAVKRFNNLVTVPPSSWTNSIFLHYEKKPQFTVENVGELENAPKVDFK